MMLDHRGSSPAAASASPASDQAAFPDARPSAFLEASLAASRPSPAALHRAASSADHPDPSAADPAAEEVVQLLTHRTSFGMRRATPVHQYVYPRRSTVLMTPTRAPIKPLRIHRPKRIVRPTPSLQPQLRPRPTCVQRLFVLANTRAHECTIRDVICRPVIARAVQ